MTEDLDRLRYPLGQPVLRSELTREERRGLIDSMDEFPTLIRDALDGLIDAQLDTPYRPGGWSVRQVVHHLADSHVNGYIRFKKAVTEREPVVALYDQPGWAEQPDARAGSVGMSLVLLEGLHRRWVAWMESAEEADWSRTVVHPEKGRMNLNQLLCLYEWHCRHHVAHITELRGREGW